MVSTEVSSEYSIKLPSIKSYKYDFGRVQFVDGRGRPVDAQRLHLGAISSDGRASRAGEATLRRGILIQSLMDAESGERPGILENVLRGASQLVKQDGGRLIRYALRYALKTQFQKQK